MNTIPENIKLTRTYNYLFNCGHIIGINTLETTDKELCIICKNKAKIILNFLKQSVIKNKIKREKIKNIKEIFNKDFNCNINGIYNIIYNYL